MREWAVLKNFVLAKCNIHENLGRSLLCQKGDSETIDCLGLTVLKQKDNFFLGKYRVSVHGL